MFPFWCYQLDGVLFYFYFFILPSKEHGDATDDLQYFGGKTATMSEMSLKNGLKVWFWKKYKYKHRLSRKTAHLHNELKIVIFHDSFTNLYKRFFVLSWTLCMSGEQWVSGFVWHQSIMVTKESTEIWVLSDLCTTWYPWIQIVLIKSGV